MEFKNLDELKKFVEPLNIEFNQTIDKQVKNSMLNDKIVLFAYWTNMKDASDGFSMEKFYCDKNGDSITREQYNTRNGKE